MAKPDLFHKRKYRRLGYHLAREMTLQAYGEILALGFLETLWQECYARCDDYLGDAVDVELAAGWQGEPGRLVALLAECGGAEQGFIEEIPERPGEYRIHDFWEHAPDFVKKRQARKEQEKAKRQADAEPPKPKKPRKAKPDAERRTTADDSPTERPTTAGTTAPNGAERPTNADPPVSDRQTAEPTPTPTGSAPADDPPSADAKRRTASTERRTNGAERRTTSTERSPSASGSASAAETDSSRTPPPTPAPRPRNGARPPADAERSPRGRPSADDGRRAAPDSDGSRATERPPDGAKPEGVGVERPSGESLQRYSEQIDQVFDAHDLGLRCLAEIEGREFRPHNRKYGSRRHAIGDAVRAMGYDTIRQAARNIVFSAHHRGDNQRKSRFLDVEYALRRPETFAELYEGSDENLSDALRRSLEESRSRQSRGPANANQPKKSRGKYVEMLFGEDDL